MLILKVLWLFSKISSTALRDKIENLKQTFILFLNPYKEISSQQLGFSGREFVFSQSLRYILSFFHFQTKCHNFFILTDS